MTKIINFIAHSRIIHNIISFIINYIPQFVTHNILKSFRGKNFILLKDIKLTLHYYFYLV